MTNRERFHSLMSLKPVDRLPVIEWAPWWDKTLGRWRDEGLPALTTPDELDDYFGLDKIRQLWVRLGRSTMPPKPPDRPFVSNTDDYLELRQHLYPDPWEQFDRHAAEALAQRQQTGEVIVWLTLSGFFWHPRELFGIEGHLYAFYEHPELMHMINADLARFNASTFETVCEVLVPDFVTFAEDMSYKQGPMISRDLFDEYMAPYYRQILPAMHERGVCPFVDSDGDITELIPWFLNAGMSGFLPIERQAGSDIVAYRAAYPRVPFIGAFDKMVMNQGEAAMRAEFERLLPVMKQGAFMVGVDHQTPPGVSLEDYWLFLRLFREHAEKGRPLTPSCPRAVSTSTQTGQ